MIKVNLMKIILNVVEDFKQDLKNQNKDINLITTFLIAMKKTTLSLE